MTRERFILLVDDNDDDVTLALRAFAQSALAPEIVVARDGAAALDYLFCVGAWASRDASHSPAVVLLDINLPKLDGLEVLRRLRADPRTHRLPVVMLTSSRDERDIVASAELGANSFVRKPIDFSAFAAAAHQLGVYWLTLNETAPGSGSRDV